MFKKNLRAWAALAVTAALFATMGAGCFPPPPPVGPQVTVTATPTSGTNSVDVTLAATVTGGTEPYTYAWTASPATTITGADTANASATVTATTVFTCTVTDADTNTDSADVTVTVTQAIQVSISGATTATGGDSVALTALVSNQSGAVSFSWLQTAVGTAGSATLIGASSQNAVVTFSTDAEGAFSFQVTATDSVGADTATQTITVLPGGFDLTVDTDIFTGTAGDDVFTAGIGTIQVEDVINGAAGNDVLNAEIAANVPAANFISVETMNFTLIGTADRTVDATNFVGTTGYSAAGTAGLTINAAEAGADFTMSMGAGYADILTLVPAGAPTSVALTLNGTAAGAVFEYNGTAGANVLDTMTVEVTADSVIGPATATLFEAAAGDIVLVDPIAVTGAGGLTIQDVAVADLASALDASALTGAFVISVGDVAGGAFDFSDGAAQQALGIDQVTLQEGVLGAITAIFDDTDNNVVIEVALAETETAGPITASYLGGGADDALTINLAGDGDGCGAIVVNGGGPDLGVDTLTINSGGTTANTIGPIVMGDQAFVTETVVITGDQDLTTTLAGGQSVVVNASALTGDLNITGDGVSDQITGGAGDDTITGLAGNDQLNGGAGDDRLSGGPGADQVTGGEGVDTFVLNTITANADRELIQDFVAGAGGDELAFDAVTFTDYTVGADVTFADCASGDVDPNAAADDVIMVDTAANIVACANTAGAQNVIAIASDTGNIHYIPGGVFAANVVIGNMTAAQVANLVAENVVIE